MATVNPRLLEQQEKPVSPVVPRRNERSISVTTVIRSALSSIFDNKILKVSLSNEDKSLLEKAANQKGTEIGKAGNISTQAIDSFKAANVEELKLENVASLSVAVKQLEPIVKALNTGNSNEKQTIGLLNRLSTQFTGLAQVLSKLANKELRVPDKQVVSGSVEITKMPASVQLSEVASELRSLRNDLSKIEKKTEVKAELSQGKEIAESLQDISDKLANLPDNMQFPATVEVSNFPPQKYPMPVTNMSINGLGGFPAATPVTVGTTPQALPSDPLESRRSMIVYNNSSSTLYLGGSDVSSTTGLPVPANSYSPALDAGEKMLIYGVAASGTINVRVLELSDIRTGR